GKDQRSDQLAWLVSQVAELAADEGEPVNDRPAEPGEGSGGKGGERRCRGGHRTVTLFCESVSLGSAGFEPVFLGSAGWPVRRRNTSSSVGRRSAMSAAITP